MPRVKAEVPVKLWAAHKLFWADMNEKFIWNEVPAGSDVELDLKTLTLHIRAPKDYMLSAEFIQKLREVARGPIDIFTRYGEHFTWLPEAAKKTPHVLDLHQEARFVQIVRRSKGDPKWFQCSIHTDEMMLRSELTLMEMEDGCG